MSLFFGPPDSYWEQPEPSPEAVLEEAEWQADQLVSEWADGAEVELTITVNLQRGGEPLFELVEVNRDGILLEAPALEVEELDAIRAWLERAYPLPTDE